MQLGKKEFSQTASIFPLSLFSDACLAFTPILPFSIRGTAHLDASPSSHWSEAMGGRRRRGREGRRAPTEEKKSGDACRQQRNGSPKFPSFFPFLPQIRGGKRKEEREEGGGGRKGNWMSGTDLSFGKDAGGRVGRRRTTAAIPHSHPTHPSLSVCVPDHIKCRLLCHLHQAPAEPNPTQPPPPSRIENLPPAPSAPAAFLGRREEGEEEDDGGGSIVVVVCGRGQWRTGLPPVQVP